MPKLRRSCRTRTARITWQAGTATATNRVTKRLAKRVTSKTGSITEAKASSSETQDNHFDLSSHQEERAGRSISNSDHSISMLVNKLKEIFSAHVLAHPECNANSVQAARYMRNKFPFYGIKTPERRSLQKQFLTTHGDVLKERTVLMGFVRQLWAENEREMQYVGLELVRQFRSEVLGSSEADFDEAVSFVEGLVMSKSWWDTVDMLSYPVVGYFVGERKNLGKPLMKKWISADDLWLRRVAILHQLCMKDKTDEKLLFSFCLACSHETEFFIRKTIGWALRDYARSNKEGVKTFVREHEEKLSPLSVREALKHC